MEIQEKSSVDKNKNANGFITLAITHIQASREISDTLSNGFLLHKMFSWLV